MKVPDVRRNLVPDTWTADGEGALPKLGPCTFSIFYKNMATKSNVITSTNEAIAMQAKRLLSFTVTNTLSQ